ncbi:hypothetical protein H4582DRAFT_1823603 [Lactarius indigo]|nr:hypothetical protein H4582DRAFT_1823603 [Lactarius indigo]
MLLANTAPHAGLANDSRGIVTDIILDAREDIGNNHAGTTKLNFPPVAILFTPFGETEQKVGSLPRGVLPILPIEKTFRVGGKNGISVKRRQFALTPAYAFTDFKAQGQTLKAVIVDVGKPPTGSLNGFNAYIALSRSRGRDTIRLLRDFDKRLFTVHPNETLRTEDTRLEELAAHTVERYHAGEYHHFTHAIP